MKVFVRRIAFPPARERDYKMTLEGSAASRTAKREPHLTFFLELKCKWDQILDTVKFCCCLLIVGKQKAPPNDDVEEMVIFGFTGARISPSCLTRMFVRLFHLWFPFDQALRLAATPYSASES
jgi:hypothetical protein